MGQVPILTPGPRSLGRQQETRVPPETRRTPGDAFEARQPEDCHRSASFCNMKVSQKKAIAAQALSLPSWSGLRSEVTVPLLLVLPPMCGAPDPPPRLFLFLCTLKLPLILLSNPIFLRHTVHPS